MLSDDIRSDTETAVLPRSADSGLVAPRSQENLFNHLQGYMARDVAEGTGGCSFYIYYWPACPRDQYRIQEWLVFASTIDVPDPTIDVFSGINASVIETCDTVRRTPLYRRSEDFNTRMARHFQFTRQKSEKEIWLVDVNSTYDNYEDIRQKFLSMLEKYETLWRVHIGRVTVSRHGVDPVDNKV